MCTVLMLSNQTDVIHWVHLFSNVWQIHLVTYQLQDLDNLIWWDYRLSVIFVIIVISLTTVFKVMTFLLKHLRGNARSRALLNFFLAFGLCMFDLQWGITLIVTQFPFTFIIIQTKVFLFIAQSLITLLLHVMVCLTILEVCHERISLIWVFLLLAGFLGDRAGWNWCIYPTSKLLG